MCKRGRVDIMQSNRGEVNQVFDMSRYEFADSKDGTNKPDLSAHQPTSGIHGAPCCQGTRQYKVFCNRASPDAAVVPRAAVCRG